MGMQYLRRISTRRLLALCAATVAVGAGATAIAMAATGGGPKPPAEPLPVAVHDALTAPAVQGVSARIQFTNHLISGSDIQGADPILSGASGRLWATSDGHLRLELQADASSEGATSDSQVVSDGHRAWAYDSGSNTVFEGTVPAGQEGNEEGSDSANEQPPSLAQVEKGIARLAEHAGLSGAEPTDIAGQPAYTVRVEPKRDAGLLGGAELAWDAVHGAPLRAAVYARGDSSPVLELKVTDISYGSVPSSVFDISPPPDAQVTNVSPPAGHDGGQGESAPVSGLQSVQQQVSFPVAAPDALAAVPRNEVRLIQSGKDSGALVTYGQGLGGIAVLERPAEQPAQGSSAPSGDQGQLTLPTVSVDGAQGEELDTALGTMIRFQRNGVEYTVLASAPPSTVLTAARAL